MVKDKSDKTKISNWEDGDVFALKIKSKEYPKYNNRYIILIHIIIDKNGWKTSARTLNNFRAKITKDSSLPTTKEKIEKLEYIKTSLYNFNTEHYRFPKEVKNIYPDNYNFIYAYVFQLKTLKYKVPEELIYINNFNVKKPKNEYIPNSQHNKILYSFWNEEYSKIVEKLLQHYEWFNLKKNSTFDKEYQKELPKKEKEEIKLYKYLENLRKEIEGPKGEEVLKAMGIDIEKEKPKQNSITYVGEKNQKK